MPVYDYKCGDCGEVVDKPVQLDSRDNVWYCWCGGKMKRKFGVGGVYIR